MKVSKDGRPLCEICGLELVTPEDLPRDVGFWSIVEPDFLGGLDETNYRRAKGAFCTSCFWDEDDEAIDLPGCAYVAERFRDWRFAREAQEEKRLKKWNENAAATRRENG